MGAESMIARGFGYFETDLALDDLPLGIHQSDQANGDIEDVTGGACYTVKAGVM
jgi:hypothetical protein